MPTISTLQHPTPSPGSTRGTTADRQTVWLWILSAIAVIATAVAVAYATGFIGADDTTDGIPAADEPADVPAKNPAPKPSATVRYDEEPRANWDVAGVAADDMLNVRDEPGTGGAIVATLAHDAAEFESTGRIAHVDDQLWREVIVPGDGVGWVNSAYLAETAVPADVRYDEEFRANWDVTGVTADDVLNVRDAPGIDGAIVATLPHDAAEFESTGRIAHVGDQLWREIVVPGDGVGWVSAAFLTETR